MSKYKAGDLLEPIDKDDMPIGYQHDEFESIEESKQFSGCYTVRVRATGLEFVAADWYLDTYFAKKKKDNTGNVFDDIGNYSDNVTFIIPEGYRIDIEALMQDEFCPKDLKEQLSGIWYDEARKCNCETAVLMREGCQCGGE